MTQADKKAEDFAGALIAAVLRRARAGEKSELLRQLIRHAAASLAILEGDQAAAEACYRVADSAAISSEGAPS